MINSFIVSLVNSGTQPTNPSSVVGDIYWPTNIRVKTYTGEALNTEFRIFGGVTGQAKLTRAVQLTWLVQNSLFSDYITKDDHRITYNDTQLEGQLISVSSTELDLISKLLVSIPLVQPPSFLPSELAEPFRSCLSPSDRLAALVCYYGGQWLPQT